MKKKKKKILLSMSVVIFISIIFYIAGCVAEANFNISQWSENARQLIASFWLICVCIGATVPRTHA